MRFDELNEDNFLLFAIKNYENPQALTKEDFDRDVNYFKYIKRLLKKYRSSGELKSHLLLNHFIFIYNIFGNAATPMLFYKIEEELWPYLKSFLIFLNRLPENQPPEVEKISPCTECLFNLREFSNGRK